MTQNETFDRLIALSEEARPTAPAVHASLQAIAVPLSVGLEHELLGIITTFTPLMERIKQAHRFPTTNKDNTFQWAVQLIVGENSLERERKRLREAAVRQMADSTAAMGRSS